MILGKLHQHIPDVGKQAVPIYAILRTATIRYRYRKYNSYNSAVPEYEVETFETKKRNTTSFTILKIINKVFALISANETPTCRIIALLINNIQ